jgi:cellobiose dehydrogenase (acceptor)
MTMHNGGFGAFGLQIANTTSSAYGTYAAIATGGSDSVGSSGNVTSPIPVGDSMSPVSSGNSAVSDSNS